jgi:hypothetical protein
MKNYGRFVNYCLLITSHTESKGIAVVIAHMVANFSISFVAKLGLIGAYAETLNRIGAAS